MVCLCRHIRTGPLRDSLSMRSLLHLNGTAIEIFWPMGSWGDLPQTHLKRQALGPTTRKPEDPHKATTLLGRTPDIEKSLNTTLR